MLRQSLRKLKAYINRDKFKDITGDIDPWEYQELFIAWATHFGVMDVDKIRPWMYVIPVMAILCASIGGVLFLMAFTYYTSILDMPRMIESGTFLMLMIHQLLCAFSIVSGREKYRNLMRNLKDDFNYICTTGQNHRSEFFKNQAGTFKGTAAAASILFGAATGMVLLASIGVAIVRSGQEKDAPRPLPISLWFFNYDLHASPLYEISFGVFYILTYSFCFPATCMSMSHVIWIREIAAKVDIIIWNLEEVLSDVAPAKNKAEKEYYSALISRRMSDIVKMHLNMFSLLEDYASVFKKCILFEQMISAPVICMAAYGFVKNLETGHSQYLSLPLCLGVVIMEYWPNYLCTYLQEKIESISDACWNMPFWNASGSALTPYLVLIMQRSMHPLPIASPGFRHISLETYCAILTRAYSGFNMLRQVDFDFN